MLPILNVGPLAVPVPELLLLAGVWFGLSLAEKHAPRRAFHTETLYNLVSVILLSGVLAARAAYALRYSSAFAASPASLLSLNPGLLDSGGGLVGGLLAGWIYGQRKGLALWPTLDALAPLLGVMLVMIPLANLASGGAYGAETDLPWAITLWGAARHPAQLYEASAAGLILARLFPAPGMANRPAGQDFLLLATWSAAARLLLEAFRGDSLTIFGELRAAQLAAWLVLAAALVLLGKMRAPREQSA